MKDVVKGYLAAFISAVTYGMIATLTGYILYGLHAGHAEKIYSSIGQ